MPAGAALVQQKPDERHGKAGLGERHADHPAQHIVLRRLDLDLKLVLDGCESRLDRCDLGG
jgi:hypothetical protein